MFEKNKIKGLDTPHELYTKNIEVFKKMRDFIVGATAVKAGDYLEYYEGMRTEKSGADPGGSLTPEGLKYLRLAPFFPMTQKAVNRHTDTLFSDPPVISVDENDNEEGLKLFAKFMSDGVEPYEFLRKYIREIIGMGRVGLHAKLDSQGKPHWFYYTAENIINWDFDPSGELFWIVLKECAKERNDSDMPTKVESITQYRVIYKTYVKDEKGKPMFDSTGGLQPSIEEVVFRQARDGESSSDEFEEVEGSRYTLMNIEGEYLQRIPFKITNISGDPKDVDEPPLIGLADINCQHYNASAMRAFANMFCSAPMLKATGLVEGPGSGGVLSLPPGCLVKMEDNGNLEYMEWKAESVSAVDKWLEEIEKKGAVLSDGFVEPNKKEVPVSYRTEQVQRRMGDSGLEQVSAAAGIDVTALFRFSLLNFLEEGMSKVVEDEQNSKVKVTFNKKFTLKNVDPAALSAKARLVKEGLLAYKDFHTDLIDCRLVPEDQKPEVSLALIEKEGIYKRFEEMEKEPESVDDEIKKDVSDSNN